MVKFGDDYRFDTPTGPMTLVDLFDGSDQLVVYQFMEVGPDDFCPGCTAFTSNVTDLQDRADTGVSWAPISNMPLSRIEAYKLQMGWTMPFVSSRGVGDFSTDGGVGDGFAERLFPRGQ
jgi:predicted dithiol-disulfide oxidoreductase (DUF899 family)